MPKPVSVIIHRAIRPGCEADFESSLASFYEKSSGFPGLLGVHVVRPVGGGREYGIMRTFSGPSACEEFYASDEFRRWENQVAAFSDGPVRREEITGLEAWFAPPGSRVMVVPRRWKTAAGTWIGVFPTSIGLSLTVAPQLHALPFFVSQLIFSALMVLLLTYLIMPAVHHALRSWLEERR